MKKIFSVILAAVMLCVVCGAPAEETGEPVFATIGEALDAAGEYPVSGNDGKHYAVAMEKDGKFIRAVADVDEKANELMEAVWQAEDIDAAFAAYDEYIRSLPVAYTEEFTAAPKEQEELDAWVGKTIQDLEDAGFLYSFSGTGGGEDRIVFRMGYSVFDYEFTVDASFDQYMECQENGSYAGLIVTAAAFAGLSHTASDLSYHADGTVEEAWDSPSGFSTVTVPLGESADAAEEGAEVPQE